MRSHICFAFKSFYSNDFEAKEHSFHWYTCLPSENEKKKRKEIEYVSYLIQRLLRKIQLLCHYFHWTNFFISLQKRNETQREEIQREWKESRQLSFTITIKFAFWGPYRVWTMPLKTGYHLNDFIWKAGEKLIRIEFRFWNFEC